MESLENTQVSIHGMSSAAIIGSNYVRYDTETSPDHQYEPFFNNKLTLNNIDDRITFMYQYV